VSFFDDYHEEQEQPGFFQKYRVAIAIGSLALIGGVFGVAHMFSGSNAAPHKEAPLTMVSLAVPTPYPTPPPVPTPPPPPPEEKMIEQTPVDDNVEKPPDNPAPQEAPVSTGITGNGPGDVYNLSSKGSTLGGGSGPRKGSMVSWYASQVQNRISEALRNNRKTRSASFGIQVRIWLDSTGRVTRAKLAGSTGNPSIDEAIQNEVLLGQQLMEGPPKEMHMPINMRLSAHRPN
jgi:hypothetical protein